MHIADDVRLDNLAPQMVLATLVVHAALAELNVGTVITSGSEGDHARLTYHRNGNAIDYRPRTLTPTAAERLAPAVRARLGPNYRANLQHSPPHLHVHYDPAPSAPIASTESPPERTA